MLPLVAVFLLALAVLHTWLGSVRINSPYEGEIVIIHLTIALCCIASAIIVATEVWRRA